MQSFAQPDHQVGPSPPLLERKHRLVLLQEGVAVDSFEQLRAGEHIMDVCVAYLTVSTDFDIMQFGAKKTQRVFVLVGTCVSDRHGEDTQGEGRLLLFTLDYAMFGKDSKVESQEENDDALAKTKMEQTAAQAKFLTTIQPKLCLTWEGKIKHLLDVFFC